MIIENAPHHGIYDRLCSAVCALKCPLHCSRSYQGAPDCHIVCEKSNDGAQHRDDDRNRLAAFFALHTAAGTHGIKVTTGACIFAQGAQAAFVALSTAPIAQTRPLRTGNSHWLPWRRGIASKCLPFHLRVMHRDVLRTLKHTMRVNPESSLRGHVSPASRTVETRATLLTHSLACVSRPLRHFQAELTCRASLAFVAENIVFRTDQCCAHRTRCDSESNGSV